MNLLRLFARPPRMILLVPLAIGLALAANGQTPVGAQGNGAVLYVPRVMPVPRFYRGIPRVTLRTPTRYPQTIARNFFFAGGVNLGNAPATNTVAQPGAAPVRWVPRPTSTPRPQTTPSAPQR